LVNDGFILEATEIICSQRYNPHHQSPRRDTATPKILSTQTLHRRDATEASHVENFS
jgi:hypothetical protein